MIGEIGALGGGILPNLLGQSRQHTGSYASGFLAYAGFALIVLALIRVVSRGWIGTWVTSGGRAIFPEALRPLGMDSARGSTALRANVAYYEAASQD
jgi:hypothetical protein